jgi:hypothetical protein
MNLRQIEGGEKSKTGEGFGTAKHSEFFNARWHWHPLCESHLSVHSPNHIPVGLNIELHILCKGPRSYRRRVVIDWLNLISVLLGSRSTAQGFLNRPKGV